VTEEAEEGNRDYLRPILDRPLLNDAPKIDFPVTPRQSGDSGGTEKSNQVGDPPHVSPIILSGVLRTNQTSECGEEPVWTAGPTRGIGLG